MYLPLEFSGNLHARIAERILQSSSGPEISPHSGWRVSGLVNDSLFEPNLSPVEAVAQVEGRETYGKGLSLPLQLC